MPDAGWQDLERSWRSAPGDQDLLQRAIAAKRRLGLAVPFDLLQARRCSARTFDSSLQLEVWVEAVDGELDIVGRTGKRPVEIPPHRTWWVEPLASQDDMSQVVAELIEGDVPGLSLSRAQVGEEALEPLSQVTCLERLSFMQCSGLDHSSLTALSQLPALCDLSLVFSGGEDALPAIGDLTRLVELNLAGLSVTDAGVVSLEGLEALARLNLSRAPLTDRGLESLGRLPDLRDLRIQAAHDVTATGLRVLGPASRLQTLYLSGASLRGDDLRVLTSWDELVDVSLEDASGLDARSWPLLAGLSRLRKLTLERAAQLGDDALARVGAWPELEELTISSGTFGAAGLSALADAPRLESLILSGCGRVRDDAVEVLSQLRGLKTLSLMECAVSWRGAAAIREALPGCVVEWIEPE